MAFIELIVLNNPSKVYPNPAQEVLHLDIPFVPKQIRVLDIQGRIFLDVNPMRETLDISALEKGTYFVKISNSDGLETSIVFLKE